MHHNKVIYLDDRFQRILFYRQALKLLILIKNQSDTREIVIHIAIKCSIDINSIIIAAVK